MDDRALIPLAGVVVFFTALVWPLLRLWRATGTFGIVVDRGADACQRFVGFWLGVTVSAVGMWALAVAQLGPLAIGGWPVPWPVRLLGWALFTAGLVLAVAAQANMGPSWRIGVDDRATALVTHGLYAWIRNPIYTGMLAMLVGLALIAPSPWTVMGLAQAYLLLGIQTRLEEQHLLRLHGDAWRAWAARVGRFLPGLGLMPTASPRGSAIRPRRGRSILGSHDDPSAPGRALDRETAARVRAEEGLAAAESRLQAIVLASQDAIIGQDLGSVVTSWNPGAERIFGYSAAEIVGTPVTRLMDEDRRSEEEHIVGRILRGEDTGRLETVRRTKDGRRIHVTIDASPIRDVDGRIVGATKIVRDTTLLKEREHEIARLSRLYVALSHVNQAVAWTPTRDDLFRKICRILAELGGFALAWIGWRDADQERLVPVAWWGHEQDYLRDLVVGTDDGPLAQGPTGTAFREGRPYLCNDLATDPATLPWREELARRGFRASAVFPIREGGVVRGALSVYADEIGFFHDKEIALLSEAADNIAVALDHLAREDDRRRAEAVARSERLFSDTMIESMPGVLYFYDESGRFLRWNLNFELVSGYTGAEIATMHLLQFFAEGDQGAVAERIAETFAIGVSYVEAPLRSKDGTATPYYFTGKRVVIDGNRCLVGVGIDISERKRAETALRDLNESLEHIVEARTGELKAALVRAEAADRLKSAFLATMSHELRTPLNSILGFTGIVLGGMAGPLNDEQHKQLGMVRGSARHLLELINDVLDLSKIESDQLEVRSETFDPREAIDRVLASVGPLATKKGLSVSASVSPEVGAMTGDRRRFEQILLNLLNNAIKFTEVGGVTLTADHVEVSTSAAPALRVRVADSGMGMRPEDLATLFQPFRQIDAGLARLHEGTGLGLAICRRLATLLGGQVSVTSEWGRGSEFTVTLPTSGEST